MNLPALDLQALQDGALAAMEWDAAKDAAGLAVARLWHTDDLPDYGDALGPEVADALRTLLYRTTQRIALQNQGSMGTVVIGGNRSGKTEALIQQDVAVALGRDHPQAQRWAEANGVDTSWWPRKGGRVWVVSLTNGDSIEYIRPALDRYLPPGTVRRNWNAQNEATAIVPGGGRLVLKTVDSGERRFQGGQPVKVHFDEEPTGNLGHRVWEESQLRLADHRGRCVLSAVPLSGRTWMVERYVERSEPGWRVHRLLGLDNPFVPRDRLMAILRALPVNRRLSRALGLPVLLEGRIYPMWDPQRHVLHERVHVQQHWLWYESIDFGTRHPTAWLFAAYDPDADVLYLLAEHYQAQLTVAEHYERAKRIRAALGYEEPTATIYDPGAAGAQMALELHAMGCRMTPARKSVHAGIDAVSARLQTDPNGGTGAKVSAGCTNFLREIPAYVWKTSATKADPPEAPLKRGDHAMDAYRYLCFHLARVDHEVAWGLV